MSDKPTVNADAIDEETARKLRDDFARMYGLDDRCKGLFGMKRCRFRAAHDSDAVPEHVDIETIIGALSSESEAPDIIEACKPKRFTSTYCTRCGRKGES